MTQSEIVQETIKGKKMSIQDVAKATGIKEPNIRRILGQGTKKGVFMRVSKGVYTINQCENCKEKIKHEGICKDCEENMRICLKCGNAMAEGFIYNDNTYCCEACLFKDIPEKQWHEEYSDDGDNYYTEWESIYMD